MPTCLRGLFNLLSVLLYLNLKINISIDPFTLSISQTHPILSFTSPQLTKIMISMESRNHPCLTILIAILSEKYQISIEFLISET